MSRRVEGEMMFDLHKNNSFDIEVLLLKAQHNEIDAQIGLALAYYHGNGVEEDIQKAHYWLEQAGKVAEKVNTMEETENENLYL